MPLRSNKKKMAIAGAGITGAYLYRRLRKAWHEIDIFDVEHGIKCGITPCAWGTSKGFNEFVTAAGLDPEAYILRQIDHLLMDEVRIEAELMTFDKPRLVKDMLKGAEIKHSHLDVEKYDRVVDATGVSRAFLPAIEDDIILRCMQRRVETHEILENQIKLGAIGYAWCFPLSDHVYHIGCGSLTTDPSAIMGELGWFGKTPSQHCKTVICGCTGKVRLTAPHYSRPFVTGHAADGVWGVGEAIACVAPLAGDGVVPGMRSVEILINNWDDPDGYTQAILKEFNWMKRERKVIDKLIRMKYLGINDAWVLKKNSRRMGMQIGFREATMLMKNLR